MSPHDIKEPNLGSVAATPVLPGVKIGHELDHLSADQIEGLYQRYLAGEKVSGLLNEFAIKTNANTLLPLLPLLEREDLMCRHCGDHATQKRAARNSSANRPICIGCGHIHSLCREDVCGCIGCVDEYLSRLNGDGMNRRVPYEGLSLREKIILLAALTMAGTSDVTSFSLFHRERWHRRLAPTPDYRDKCIDELFSRHIILVSTETSPDALDFHRRHESRDYLWWCPNVSADAEGIPFNVPDLQALISYDLAQSKAGLEDVLTRLLYELAEEELLEYVCCCVEKTRVSFKSDRATRESLRPLLASSSVSNIYSFIWRAVKQADEGLHKGVFRGGQHAGNWLPKAIVQIAEEEKQNEYERLKSSRISQLSEVIYAQILDDPDGSFKIPLPRYIAEVMRPVLEQITSAKQAKLSRAQHGQRKGRVLGGSSAMAEYEKLSK